MGGHGSLHKPTPVPIHSLLVYRFPPVRFHPLAVRSSTKTWATLLGGPLISCGQRPPDRSAVPNKEGTDDNDLNKEDTTTLFHSYVS